MTEYQITRPDIAPKCYACGPDNAEGLKLTFVKSGPNEIKTRCLPRETLNGWPGVLHGGFTSMLLDETACWAVFGIVGPIPVATVEITVQFLKPVPVNTEIEVSAKIAGRKGRLFLLEARLTVKGETCATAKVKCLEIKPDQFKPLSDPPGAGRPFSDTRL